MYHAIGILTESVAETFEHFIFLINLSTGLLTFEKKNVTA